MEFIKKLALLVIDKVIIAGIAFYLWHLYTKSQEAKKEEAEKRKELENQLRRIKKEKDKTELNEKIILLEQQLEKFYWPISLCMKNDDAVWQRVPSLYDDGNQLPTESGAVVEKEFLLPNHEKAVKVIEDNFHLISHAPKFEKLAVDSGIGRIIIHCKGELEIIKSLGVKEMRVLKGTVISENTLMIKVRAVDNRITIIS